MTGALPIDFESAYNSTISKGAERALRKTIQGRTDINIDFVGQDRLIDQIDELWPEFYQDQNFPFFLCTKSIQ